HPTSVSGVQNIGTVLANGVATDLSPSDVLGYATVRLEAHRLTDCVLPPHSSLTSASGQAPVAVFAGSAAPGAATAACTEHPLAGSLGGVAGALERTVVAHLPAILISALVV